MGKGKCCAQVTHASVKSILVEDEAHYSKIQSWLDDRYKGGSKK